MRDGIGVWEAAAIGIGGMVGGGIFAVLGLSVQLARGGAPLAFALAGGVALATTYSYVKLAAAFPGPGGTVSFVDRAFDSGLLAGSVNILLWLSYVVMLSLYASAFGSYGASLLPHASQVLWAHLLTSGVILLITALNVFSAALIGAAELWIVAVKIGILLLFVAVGLPAIEPARLAVSQWAPALPLAAGGMIIFLAYEGFELIANASGDLREPKRNIPRAFSSSVVFVIALYVAVAAVTVGTLPVDTIVAARDYALAIAARPTLGHAGDLAITVAALLSTASAINATLYGAARLSYTIARDGELPASLERKIWNKPLEGLFITAAATLVVANGFSLSSISTMGSAGFLLIFAAVNAANCRLAGDTGSRRWLSAAALLLCLAALTALVVQTARQAPSHLWVLVALVGLSVGIEFGWRQVTGRRITLSPPE